jgi:hypothetical protein
MATSEMHYDIFPQPSGYYQSRNWLQNFCYRNIGLIICYLAFIFTILVICAAILAYFMSVLSHNINKFVIAVTTDYSIISEYGHQLLPVIDSIISLFNHYLISNNSTYILSNITKITIK